MSLHTLSARTMLVLLALLPAACVTVSESNPTPPKVRAEPRGQLAQPARLLVSPLTRIGIDPAGDAAIFLHLDFRDATDRSVKAFGQLRVELFPPGAPGATAPASPARTWDADLSDPVRNALSFDELITRTYTINLSGVPDWLVRWARHEGPDSGAPAPTITVQFLPTGATSADHALKATCTLTR